MGKASFRFVGTTSGSWTALRLIVYIQGITQSGDIREWSPGEEIWAQGGKVTGDWIKLHIENLHHLSSSPNIVRVIRSRTMDWMELSAGAGEKEKCIQGFVWGT